MGGRRVRDREDSDAKNGPGWRIENKANQLFTRGINIRLLKSEVQWHFTVEWISQTLDSVQIYRFKPS